MRLTSLKWQKFLLKKQKNKKKKTPGEMSKFQ